MNNTSKGHQIRKEFELVALKHIKSKNPNYGTYQIYNSLEFSDLYAELVDSKFEEDIKRSAKILESLEGHQLSKKLVSNVLESVVFAAKAQALKDALGLSEDKLNEALEVKALALQYGTELTDNQLLSLITMSDLDLAMYIKHPDFPVPEIEFIPLKFVYKGVKTH